MRKKTSLAFPPVGRGPEIGAISDQISTPNLWGVLLITFPKNRQGKPSDTGFEIIRPRRSQQRVAMVCPTDISEINFTRESYCTIRLLVCGLCMLAGRSFIRGIVFFESVVACMFTQVPKWRSKRYSSGWIGVASLGRNSSSYFSSSGSSRR